MAVNEVSATKLLESTVNYNIPNRLPSTDSPRSSRSWNRLSSIPGCRLKTHLIAFIWTQFPCPIKFFKYRPDRALSEEKLPPGFPSRPSSARADEQSQFDIPTNITCSRLPTKIMPEHLNPVVPCKWPEESINGAMILLEKTTWRYQSFQYIFQDLGDLPSPNHQLSSIGSTAETLYFMREFFLTLWMIFLHITKIIDFVQCWLTQGNWEQISKQTLGIHAFLGFWEQSLNFSVCVQ